MVVDRLTSYTHLFVSLLLVGLTGCTAVSTTPHPVTAVPASATPLPATTASPTVTDPAVPTQPFAPTASPTAASLTLLFYGDSVLKVGDVNQPASDGFSFIDPLKTKLPVADRIIVSNHGGRRARWGYENLQENVLRLQPDVVTLWWGMNDLGGCPGIFDRETNQMVDYMLAAYIREHIQFMQAQIDALLEQHITVLVMTPLPVLGKLPWSHFTSDGQLVWENDHHCEFNLGLQKLVEAQRSMVESNSARQAPVYLVDAWQVYKDNPNAGKMYMDVVHPASHGVQLIADEWLRVFDSVEIHR
jgi:lysophospholipase L1-like esterase